MISCCVEHEPRGMNDNNADREKTVIQWLWNLQFFTVICQMCVCIS